MGDVLLGDVPHRGALRRGPDSWAIRHGDDVLTWGAFADGVNRRAHALAGRNIRQGDRVVIALANGNDLIEMLYAVWKLGATPTMVSPRLPPAEFQAIVMLAEPSAIISEMHPGSLPPEFGRDHPERSPRPSLEAPSWKAMTSGGSTGRPKLIVDHLPSRMPEGLSLLRMPRDGVMLNAAPLTHNFPFAAMQFGLMTGNSLVGMTRFDAEEVLRLIATYRVQWTALVPTMMHRIARLPGAVRSAYDLSSLQTLWHTAAPIAPELKQFWIDWIGPEHIWEMYGGTEGFATTQLSGTEWQAHPGSVGRPVGADILIRGEHGDPLPAGEVGEIYMRRHGSEGSPAGYHYEGAQSRRLADGFESFGDFGRVDADGYLYIADRRTDLIVTGGHNVYPAEVEAALLGHPDVAEAIAIGLPDDDLGASVHGIVRLESHRTATADTLLAFARERLESYKLPRSIEFTDASLRDDAGKARRSKLRADRLR